MQKKYVYGILNGFKILEVLMKKYEQCSFDSEVNFKSWCKALKSGKVTDNAVVYGGAMLSNDAKVDEAVLKQMLEL